MPMLEHEAPAQGQGPRLRVEQPNAARLRGSAAIRVFLALLLSGAATAAAILLTNTPEPPVTDVVGHPIFSDFNIQNYFNAYYAVIGLFPIAALLIFIGLTRIAPRIGLPVPPPRGHLRPDRAQLAEARPLEPQPPLETMPAALQYAISAGRTAFVGAVLGLEAGIVAEHTWAGVALGAVAYSAVAVLIAAAARRWMGHGKPLRARLAAVNAVLAPLTIAGLVAVSSRTQVTIVSNGSVHGYPWFPVWLGLPVAAGLAVLVALRIRRAHSPARVRAIERGALLLVLAPVGLFLLLASLPGDLGPVEMYESGQPLMGAKLVGEGWFPWRDVIVTHGLFQDASVTWIGHAIFENNYWGHVAGTTMLISPLFYLGLYFLFVYLFGRNWLYLTFLGLLILGTTWITPINTRFILWPLILLILAALLDHQTPLRGMGLAFVAVLQVIVTPEAAPLLAAIGVVVVLFEWYERRPETALAAAFRRTIWFGASAVALLSLFAGFLAAAGALDDFTYVNSSFLPGHALSGGIPPTPVFQSDLRFGIEALTPLAGFLISFAYLATRLWLRRRLRTEDWVMGAAAVFALAYYPKFLSYMDTPHLAEVFGITLPLLLFIVFRLVTWGEVWIRSRWPGNPILRAAAHPISLILVVIVAVLGAGRVEDHVANAETNYRPQVAAPPTSKPIGYSSAPFDPVMYRDLRRVIDAYLDPNDRLFDFTNAPTYYYYLMDRNPSTRYIVVLIAHSERLQADVIKRLREAAPKLIIFDATAGPGFSNWDGIPNMVRHYDVSRWILDHYRPLLATHFTTIYARRDMPPPSPLGLRLSERPITRGVDFRGQPCTWGYTPNFLERARDPSSAARPVNARIIGPPQPQISVDGWAADVGAEAPAHRIVVMIDGKVAARLSPHIGRPDLIAAGFPPGYDRSGFTITVPVSRRPGPHVVKVVGIAHDGSATELLSEGAAPEKTAVRIGSRTFPIDPEAIQGSVDSITRTTALGVELPRGSHWRDYRWLEVDAGAHRFSKGSFMVYDRRSRPYIGREISFQTLDDSPTHYTVPVASCPQWHGYRGRRLFLAYDVPQDVSGVRLIR
jgi:hypothetical protein